VRDYDVLSADKFVAVVPTEEAATGSGPSAPQEIRIVLNWTEELKRLVPVK
jgi:hypothetical protein